MIAFRQFQALDHVVLAFLRVGRALLIIRFGRMLGDELGRAESLEFDRIHAGIRGGIDQALGHIERAVVVHTGFGNDVS
ncbi:hypothetical protein D3C85_1602290 [compost metagenome]